MIDTDKLKRDLCVVGHGRGATSFVARWLQAQGIEAWHERVGPRGIVESGFSVGSWGVRDGVNCGLGRGSFDFEHTICVLRDPWKVIATYNAVEHPLAILGHLEHIPEIMGDILESHPLGPDDTAARVNLIARSVVLWTKSGMHWADWQFRVEDQLEEFYAFLLMEGFTEDDMVEVPPNTINSTPGKRLDKTAIKDLLSPEQLDLLANYCAETGYEY
jgi:hypothetical protein